jgi:hypothetical protein
MFRYRPRLKQLIFPLNATPPRSSVAGACSIYPHKLSDRRTIINVPPLLLPPVVFSGLLLALWTWKCFMMVIFQNKIIYMPGLPPNARRKKISDYININQSGDVMWQEVKIVSIDKTQLSLCVGNIESLAEHSETPSPVYVVYFQGESILCHYLRVLVKLTCFRERLVLASPATISLSSLTCA